MARKSQKQLQKKTQRRDRMVKIIALVIMFTALIVYICMDIAANNGSTPDTPRKSTLVETNVSLYYDLESNSSFHTYGKGFFHITKDGVKYQTADGNGKYDSAYTMLTAPVVVANEGVIAVAEARGRSLYVFNSSGNMYTKQMNGTILTFSVNKNGYSAVITKDGDDYSLDVFNDKGNPARSGSFTEYNIFPVAVDISADNRILAVSFVNVSNVQTSSNIVFSYINATESIKYADGIFANKNLDNQFVGVVKFGENNSIAMISEKEITVIKIDQYGKYTQTWNKTLTNEINLISFNGGKNFAIAYGGALKNMEGLEPGTVELYEFSGTKVLSHAAGGRATHLSAAANAVIVGIDRKFTAYGKRGELWTYYAAQEVKQLLFLDNTNTALFAAGNRATVMKLGKEQTE